MAFKLLGSFVSLLAALQVANGMICSCFYGYAFADMSDISFQVPSPAV